MAAWQRDREWLHAELPWSGDLRDPAPGLAAQLTPDAAREILIRRADRVLDMGPGAGRYGGQVVASGTPADVARTSSASPRAT